MNEASFRIIWKTEFVWILLRTDVTHDAEEDIHIPEHIISAWGDFNRFVTKEDITPKTVGFLPLLPQPVTQYDTVYTALKNFQCIRRQLNQAPFVVACDEEVYHIAREIFFIRCPEFADIVLTLCSFHMSKVFLSYIKKYLSGSGIEEIWVESGVFGVIVTNSVIKGTNFVRSLKGMMLLGEVLLRLRTLQYFDETQGAKVFSDNLEILRFLEKDLLLRNRFGAQNLLEEFTQTGQLLMADYRRFFNTLRERSETFCYWDNVIELIEQLRNLIRADGEGNWLLHMHTVQKLLHIFAAFNCTNYLRWWSIYLDDMRNLPETFGNKWSIHVRKV